MSGITQREDQYYGWLRDSGYGQFGYNPRTDSSPTDAVNRIRALYDQFGGMPTMQAVNVNAVSPSAAGRYGDYLANQAARLSSMNTGNQMWQLREQGMNPAMLAAMSGQMAAANSNAAASAYGQGFGMGLEHLGGVNSQNAQLGTDANMANFQARLAALNNQMGLYHDTAQNLFNTGLGMQLGYINSRQTPTTKGFASWGPQALGLLGRGAAAYFSGGN